MRTAAILIRTLLRRGLPALAVYALVLQAFLAGAAPSAAAFDPDRMTLCAEMAAGSGAPSPAHPGGHDGACLCVAACAMPHAPLALAPAAGPSLAGRTATEARVAWAGADAAPFPKRLTGPSARGPPRG